MKWNKYYEPIQKVTDYICKHIQDGSKVLELGPGEHPFPKATHFCGWSIIN
jgi:phosphoheptose isomerase